MGACELKRQAKLEQWKTQVIDCRSSGMSVKGWCAEHNISTKTYYRWEKEILSSAATELVPTVSAPQPPAAFAELPSADRRQSDCQHPNWERESGHLFGCGCGCGEGNLPGTEIMLSDFTGADKVYIACGYTDLRKGIDGLAAMVQQQFQLDPFTNTLFLFCGRRRDRIKGLYWERDGFILLYKRLEQGSYQWPRTENEVRQLTPQQYRWLMEGGSIDQPKAHKAVNALEIV